MSLRVWLPLTKDLRNQGLSDVTINSDSYTLNNNGKLGKCITTGNSAIDLGYNGNIINESSISFGGWFKFNKASIGNVLNGRTYTSTAPTPNGNLIGNNNYGGIGLIWMSNNMYNDGSFSQISIVPTIRTSSISLITGGSSGVISFDTWIHVFLVFDRENLKLKMYINGVLKSESSVNNFSDARSYNLFLNYNGVYGGNGPGICIPFDCNDIRIYNHALSPMEVKELAKGLVLHYPLNRQGWGQENLVVNYRNSGNTSYYSTTLSAQVYEIDSSMPSGYHQKCTIGTASGTGGPYWVGTTTNGNTGTQISQLIADAWYTVSYYIKGTTTHSGIISTTAEFLKNITFIERPTINTEWQRVTFYGQYNGNTTSNIAITIYEGSKWTAGEIFYFSSLKVEPGKIRTPWTPHSSDLLYTAMGLNGTTEYDTSGYCNNGTRTGTFNWTSDTPKYQVSTYMPKAALITHPRPVLGGTDQEWTCAMWVKLDNVTQGQQAMNNFNISNNIVHSTTPLLYLNDGTNDYYMYGSQAVSAGVWTHVVFVFKNSDGTRNVYINGVLKNNYGPNKTSIPRGIPDTVTVGTNLAGYISDYRVYATALSADDVKSLYQNCATIDPDGTIRGQIRS